MEPYVEVDSINLLILWKLIATIVICTIKPCATRKKSHQNFLQLLKRIQVNIWEILHLIINSSLYSCWSLLFFCQIGYSTSSPLFSDKGKFPLYFRTSTSETMENPSRVALLKQFNWKKVALLVQNLDIYVLVRGVNLTAFWFKGVGNGRWRQREFGSRCDLKIFLLWSPLKWLRSRQSL